MILLDILFERNHYANLIERQIQNEMLITEGENQTVLKDTMSSCFCIIFKGGINQEEYTWFLDGIRRIGGHIYHEKLNGEIAAYIACEILYLAACIYTGNEYVSIGNPVDYMSDHFSFKGARSVNYLKKVHPESYAYLAAAVRMLDNEVEDIVYFYKNF